MATPNAKRILIAPLDWGLGHTARCVPIIRSILRRGHIAIVAGNSWQRSFIEKTFAAINFVHLDGYNVIYSEWNRFAQAGLISQLPGLMKTINNEHKWLQPVVKELGINGIISDNRYGLYHPHIPSVIVTHQLQVQTGMGAFTDRSVQKLHYKYLDRFNETWVADVPGTPNLGGKLSHTAMLPKQVKYIGLLSQLTEEKQEAASDGSLLILLSGPEPQRSILSELLWQQAVEHTGKIVFVEGSESVTMPLPIPPHITYHKRLTHEALAPLMQKAGMVICRSGYSTLMDLVALNKKAILIPTPGQTEQEYLGRHLMEQGVFYSTPQKSFVLSEALHAANEFPHHTLALADVYNNYEDVLHQWLESL